MSSIAQDREVWMKKGRLEEETYIQKWTEWAV